MAAYTIWVDPVSGVDGALGTQANPVKTAVGLRQAITTLGATGNDFTVHMMNTGDHLWAGTQLTTTVTGSTFVFRGVDSSGNPAWATAYPASGTASISNGGYFRPIGHSQITVEYMKFDVSSFGASAGSFSFINGPSGTATGDITVRYCQLIGNPIGGSLTVAIYAYYRDTVSGTNSEDQTIEYCYYQHVSRFLQLWSGSTLTLTARYNVLIVSESDSPIYNQSIYGKTDFHNNTLYISASTVPATLIPLSGPVFSVALGTDPFPALTIKDNVIWRQQNPNIDAGTIGSAASAFSGNVAYTSVLDPASDIGYNVMVDGAETAPLTNNLEGYVHRPFQPPLTDGLYAGDTLDSAVADSTMFVDPSTTYDWTPSGSSLTITLPKDLRLGQYTTASSTGGPPGALPAASQNYQLTVTVSDATPRPGQSFDVTVRLATSIADTSVGVITVSTTGSPTYDSHATTTGTYNSVAGTWTNPSVPAGSFRDLVITYVAGESLERYTVTATITSITPEAAAPTADDTDSVDIAVDYDNGTSSSNPVGCVEGLYDFTRLSDSRQAQTILICASENLYWDNGRRFLTSAWNQLKSPAQYSFIPYGVYVYIASTNPKQVPLVFNGVQKTVRPVKNAPNLGFWVEHFSRLVGAGLPSEPSFIFSSATEDFDGWEFGPNDDDPITLGITIDDGQRITGLSSAHYGRLYVFKDHSISVIQGNWSSPLDVGRSTLSTSRGSINHHVIQQVGNDIFFWDEQGCHTISTTDRFGDVESQSLSVKIRNAFKELVDFNQLDKAHSINYTPEDLYITWFRSRGSTELDLAFVYNYSIGEWTIWDMTARCAAEVRVDEKQEVQLWTGTCDGFVQSYPGPQSYSSCDMWTGGLIFGDPVTVKNYEEVGIYVVPSGDFDVDLKIEFNADDYQSLREQVTSFNLRPNTGKVLGELTLDDDTMSADDEIKLVHVDDLEGGSGRSAIVKIESNAAGENLEVLGYLVRATRKAN